MERDESHNIQTEFVEIKQITFITINFSPIDDDCNLQLVNETDYI